MLCRYWNWYETKSNRSRIRNGIFSFIVQTVQQEHHLPLRLTVALFNKRAIHLYEKLGFVKAIEFSTPTEFITMLKKCRIPIKI